MVNITEIPLELLNEIIIHIETANSLINLSLTCRKLRASIEDDGFRVFAQRRFPSIQIPPYWKDAVHALTTLSRNWDRRAFVARYLLPELDSARSSDQGGKSKNHQGVIHGRQLRQQTMGYQPVIDCYEEWIGETWSSRKQILAWGAGPSLLVRSKRMGETMTQASETVTAKTWNRHHLDEHCHQSTWAEYKENGLAPGRDDISSVNLLKTAQKPSEDREYVVIGRASGLLDLVGVSTSEPRNDIVAKFETNKRPVRSATINKALSPLIAACLSNCSLSLYQIKATDSRIKPCTELTTIPSGTAGKTWCSRFLRHDCLAVGLGPTKKPIQIYAIRADGLSKSPIREDTFESDANSVYSILPLSSRSLAGGSEGDLFLSGGYDGTIRLHDLRSSKPCTAVFTDSVDAYSAIYSLAAFGLERFIAGGARHSLMKIFDLRMTGGKQYFAADLDSCSPDALQFNAKSSFRGVEKPTCCQHHYDIRNVRSNTNIFLGHYHNDKRAQRNRRDSPVYSLSSPSSCSPTLFAGIENRVIQIDIVSIMDQYPDPIFQHEPKRTLGLDSYIRMKWNPRSDALCLPASEMVNGKISLMIQSRIGVAKGCKRGFDERWQLPNS